jgi:hypothetical protein
MEKLKMSTLQKTNKSRRNFARKYYTEDYVNMQIDQHFHALEIKIAETKNELLNWFIKMFIGQVTGFISIFIALASIIKSGN